MTVSRGISDLYLRTCQTIGRDLRFRRAKKRAADFQKGVDCQREETNDLMVSIIIRNTEIYTSAGHRERKKMKPS